MSRTSRAGLDRWALMLLLAVGCNSESHAGGAGDPAAPDDGSETPPPDGPDGTSTANKPGVTPEQGATEFLSADPGGTNAGTRASGEATVPGAAGTAVDGTELGGANAADARTVERGDIFRVLPDQRILNLNAYRGVQVIDIRDVGAPRVEGRLQVTGTPVEMYVVGERALVLLNDWRGYYGSRDDVRVDQREGGLVMSVDITDRENPVLLDQAYVPGFIQTSRLTQGGGQAALYVAAQGYEQYSASGVVTAQASTVLKSFDVSGAEIVERSELDLGGYVQDIQATADVMMVASYDYSANFGVTRVALVDISRPDGEMVKGDEITTAGIVQNKFNMDVHNGVLRVVSGSNWNGGNDNHLETFDVADLGNAVALDHCTFGAGQSLFATLFVGNKGFFVTYLRQDPFHAFTIDDQGNCAERSEFIVSGWNDFFRAARGDTRLIGIGRNDENRTNHLAVSLYDITDVTNPQPLLARAEIELSWSSSEASWDDRAFSVLEDAVSVQAADGIEETGLVLLPYEGWDEDGQQYRAAVQIFTFSDTTLTRRGVMNHGTSVRRSFLTEPGTTANLSEDALSLFDTVDPNAPAELGRVGIAPNYTHVFVYGDHVARVRNPFSHYGYYGGAMSRTAAATVEIVPRAADPDGDATVASIGVPADAQFAQVGDLLVAIAMRYRAATANSQVIDTSVEVYDLSDPTQPRRRGSLTTDRIEGGYFGYYGPGLLVADCWDCRGGYWFGGSTGGLVAGSAIVFPEGHSQQKSLGWVHVCTEYPRTQPCSYDPATGVESCGDVYYTGAIECRTPRGGEEVCSGEFYVCDAETGECEPGEPALGTERTCYDHEDFRYWTSYTFEVLDLRDPDRPRLADSVELPENEEGTSVIAHGETVYFNYQQPVDVADDARPYVRRYFRAIDVSDPGAPAVGPGINVPGDVIAVDGSNVYTRDLIWDDTDTETLVARLTIDGEVARLRAQRLFDERVVSAVHADGAGHLLVSHDQAWTRYGYYYAANPETELTHKLSILADTDLAVAGETDVDSWATLMTAKAGRAIYSVSGGLLVVNVENAAEPFAQAYFATNGWASELLLDGSDILFAAGPYGIYRFDSDAFNLLSP